MKTLFNEPRTPEYTRAAPKIVAKLNKFQGTNKWLSVDRTTDGKVLCYITRGANGKDIIAMGTKGSLHTHTNTMELLKTFHDCCVNLNAVTLEGDVESTTQDITIGEITKRQTFISRDDGVYGKVIGVRGSDVLYLDLNKMTVSSLKEYTMVQAIDFESHNITVV
ncbi:hypothetical protein VPHK469_0115 [Vibrio phage K469]